MNSLILFGVLIGVVLAAVAFQKLRPPVAQDEESGFESCPELFSPAERSFLGVLEQAISGQFRVFGKVRLGDLVKPAKGLSQSRRTSIRNRLQQKHIDFVLCRPDTLAVACVVELDDASHRRRDRAERDDFVDKALSSAGILALHFPAQKGYAVAEVREKLATILGLERSEAEPAKLLEAAKVEDMTAALDPPARQAEVQATEKTASAEDKAPVSEQPAAPVCPACNSAMVKRQARKGPHAGKWFWACPGYPKCRKIMAVG
jgi:very-short-patch-repair endonuclease